MNPTTVMLSVIGGGFEGERFVRFDEDLGDEDKAVMPLYDVNGFIAGIQTGVSASLPVDNHCSFINLTSIHNKIYCNYWLKTNTFFECSFKPIFIVFFIQIRAARPGYPDAAIIPPMQWDAGLNMYTMTAYFVNPSMNIRLTRFEPRKGVIIPHLISYKIYDIDLAVNIMIIYTFPFQTFEM